LGQYYQKGLEDMKDLRVLASPCEPGNYDNGGESDGVLPEKALIESFRIAKEDYKALRLVHTWIQINHDLIHVEALVSALKETHGSGTSRLVAASLKATGEKRFDRVFKMAMQDLIPKLAQVVSFAAEIGQCKEDPTYSEFGLKVSEIDLEADKKFRSRDYLLELNSFFFCRTLFGVNWRADVAACFLLGKANSPTEVSKFLGCSYDAAYRNFHDLVAAGWNAETRKAFVSA
jgi:hypothetical protein